MKTHSELKIFKSNGYNYIYLYYKQNKSFVRINTKLYAIENQMTKENLFKSTVPDYEKKNKYILSLKRRLDKHIADKFSNPMSFEKVWQNECYNIVFGINQPTWKDVVLILPLYKKYTEKLINEHDYQNSTIKYYNNLYYCLEAYQKNKVEALTVLSFAEKKGLIDFKKFLAEKRGMNDNSIRKRINSLKSFLKYLTTENIFKYNPSIYEVKGDSYETEVIALNKSEIQQFLDLKIEDTYWQKIRDLFCFNCYMGLRASDLMSLDKGQFWQDEENDWFYTKENIKTGIEVTIPMTEIPLKILQKYEFNMPRYTGQYFNRQLEKILEHYHLFEDMIVYKRKVLKENKDSKVMKRTLVTSHTCRKSFITNCVGSGIPLNVIMKASGHKQLKTLQSYVNKTHNKNEFKKLNPK